MSDYAQRQSINAYAIGRPELPERDSYAPQMGAREQERTGSEHSWYQNGNANPGYSAGINSTAASYMKTPACGKYKPVNNLLL